MTREELFSVFPRPWMHAPNGTVYAADGKKVLTIHKLLHRGGDDVEALAELVADLVNGAEQ